MNYILTLTGAPNSTTDVILPISSFTLRLRDSAQNSYLSCVVPNVLKHGDQITARPNGSLILSTDWPLITAALADIRVIRGGSKSSINLTAYDSVANAAPKTVVLNQVQYSNSDPAGSQRIRATIQDLLPGDSVTYESITRLIESIAISVNSRQSQMELTLI